VLHTSLQDPKSTPAEQTASPAPRLPSFFVGKEGEIEICLLFSYTGGFEVWEVLEIIETSCCKYYSTNFAKTRLIEPV